MAETARDGMGSHGAGSVLALAELMSRWLLFMVAVKAQRYVPMPSSCLFGEKGSKLELRSTDRTVQ